MIYAKETPKNARAILGDDVYDSISAKTGIEGGLGHKLYEQWRALPEGNQGRLPIEAQSKAYYDAIRSKGGVVPSGANLRMSSVGGRNVNPLTQVQIDEATSYSRQLGFDGPIDYRPLDRGYNTSYSDLHWLMISDDLLPNPNGTLANSRMSWRAALGHEIVGHGQANIAGKAFEPSSLLDEVQASARASRLTPDLNDVERYQLRRDAIERIKAHNQTNGTALRWRDVRDQLWLAPAK